MPNIMTPFRCDNDIALVTGGGSGLGLATARCLAAAGARVVITGRREDVLRQAATDIGPMAVAMPADVNQLDGLPALVERVEAEVGPLGILVNNAGFQLRKAA